MAQEDEYALSETDPVIPYILGATYLGLFVVAGFYVVTAAPFL